MITHGYSQDKIQEVIGYHQTTILYLSSINIMWYLSLSLPRLSPKIFLVILLENTKNHKALNVLPEGIMEFFKVFLNFDSVDKIPWSDHSSETSLPVTSHGAIWLSKIILQNEIFEFLVNFAFGHIWQWKVFIRIFYS